MTPMKVLVACEFSGMVRQVSGWWLIPATILGAAIWALLIVEVMG
mgnify:CR=1 FL=1